MDVWSPYTTCGIATYPNRAIGMTGLSPARLRPCRPLHQTPVGSCTLAWSRPGLRPSGHCTPSAFPRCRLRHILWTTTLHMSGLHPAAYLLVPSRFVRPLLGVHVD